ncbi:hypothetical protein SAG0330_07660 [Streptococcus agalactiae GB00561]|nr:hypothetical protein SAG0330_07660 [Streptococcus agalactiae GB00561]
MLAAISPFSSFIKCLDVGILKKYKRVEKDKKVKIDG